MKFTQHLWFSILVWFAMWKVKRVRIDFDKMPCRSAIDVVKNSNRGLLARLHVEEVPAKHVVLNSKMSVNDYISYYRQMLTYIERSDDIPASIIHDYLMSRKEIPFRAFVGSGQDLIQTMETIQHLLEKTERMIAVSSSAMQYHYWTRLLPVHQDALVYVLTARDLSMRSDIYE